MKTFLRAGDQFTTTTQYTVWSMLNHGDMITHGETSALPSGSMVRVLQVDRTTEKALCQTVELSPRFAWFGSDMLS